MRPGLLVPRRGLIGACCALAMLLSAPAAAVRGQTSRGVFRINSVPRVPAGSLDGGVEWMNSSGPITLAQLRGKIVVLDFWTYCCINCIQTLPDLKQLERAYPNEVVVIGVHAPKFFGERDSQNIREAILRYGVEHPVVNDANAVIAKRYGIGGWPALRFIDPQGYLIAAHNGEATFKILDDFMKRTVAKYRRQGAIDDAPLRFDLERYSSEPGPLRFPGKLLADAASGRLFIADSGHHRIVVTSLEGKLLQIIGSGRQGNDDGALAEASFSGPQGLALQDPLLFVADTDNHLLRQVDLQRGVVSTIAGTGEQLQQVMFRSSRQPNRVKLASPWDLQLHEEELYIAMAGSHQIWKMSLSRGSIHPFAGNGVEDIVDGPALARSTLERSVASFAQPSGLTSDGDQLYVADSEGSSIRAVPLRRNGNVTTVLGTARLPAAARLFTYGDRDGLLSQGLLQHPLGVAYWRDRIFVADTYNNKIKEIDLARQQIRTLAGDGRPGSDDQPARFNEPAGLSVAGDKLYVADTNNHLIRVIDLEHDATVQTLEIEGLTPPEAKPDDGPAVPAGPRIDVGRVQVKPTEAGLTLAVQLFLGDGEQLSPDVPMSYQVDVTKGEPLLDPQAVGKRVSVTETSNQFELQLPLSHRSGQATLEISLVYFFCDQRSKALCKIGAVRWTVDLTLSNDATADRVVLKHVVR